MTEKERNEDVERMKHLFIDYYGELLPSTLNDKLRTILKEKYNYDDVILDLFDEVIEPLSPSGRNIHDKEDS